MFLASAAAVLVFASATAADVRRAVDQVYSSGHYQTELPVDATPQIQDAPQERAPWWESRRLRPASVVARALLWVAIAVLLVVAAVWIATRFARTTATGASQDEPPPAAAAVRTALPGRKAAESLAESGQFSEAIHALLLHLVDELSRRQDRPPGISLTSREILETASLTPDERSTLGQIVLAVELCHFGGRTPGDREWRRCLRHHDELMQRWAVGAA
jgi:uncharacterized protein DUF4129